MCKLATMNLLGYKLNLKSFSFSMHIYQTSTNLNTVSKLNSLRMNHLPLCQTSKISHALSVLLGAKLSILCPSCDIPPKHFITFSLSPIRDNQYSSGQAKELQHKWKNILSIYRFIPMPLNKHL